MLRIATLMIALCFSLTTNAQEAWNLQRCITYAQERNLSLKRNQIAIQNAEITDRVNHLQHMPSVSAGVNGNLRLGWGIDPTTNTVVSGSNTLGGSTNIDVGMPLYTGGRIKSTIEQGKVNLALAKVDAEVAANDIGLNIALTYLSILLAEEQANNARKRVELSEQQLERTDKLITAGSLPENDRLDILAQIARDKQNVIATENNVSLNYLNLIQFLELEDTDNFQILRPDVILPTEDTDKYNLEMLYAQALQSQPQVRANDLRVQSTEYNIEIAEAAKRPSVNIGAGINTSYSNQAPGEPSFVLQETNAFIDGQAVTLGLFQPSFSDAPKQSFGDQLLSNFGQYVGFNVSIPIYNQGRNDANIEQARLAVLDAQIQADQVKQQLKRDIQQYLANARASKLALQASEQAFDASKAAFKNTEKRFEYGAANNLEYTTARNTMDQAETDLLRAKYQYIFDCKVLDFYIGKPLNLN